MAKAGDTNIPAGGRMRRVILESPYVGDIEKNVAYARAAVRDSLLRARPLVAPAPLGPA